MGMIAMKITGLDIHPVTVRRQHRTVVGQGRGTFIPGADAAPTRSHFAALELRTSEGITGLGEWSDVAAPGRLVSSTFRTKGYGPPEDLDIPALRAVLERALVGRSPFDIEAILSDLDLDRSTLCAVDSALYDAVGKALNTPVYNLIGGRVRDRMKISWVVYIRTTDLIGDEMRAMVDRGFTAFKLKVGSDIAHDEACVRIMRETAGPDAEIKLDASGAWTVEEAIQNIQRLTPYNLQGVESPVKGRGAADLAQVRHAVGVKIIEHVWDRWDYILDLIQRKSVDVINLFPEGCGGIHRCKKVLALAEAAGIDALLGSTVELGVGTAAQVHLGVSGPQVCYPSDLIGPAMYTEDIITRPFDYVEGHLAPPEGPGLGVELDRDQLERLKT
ncbi:MAG: hypothetical protein A3F84_13615 [Candidatus Handelsmanbacteria bacterium RIFCSPLOWO2_12_FULL_64_10]|uniref:Mandelate racemase/muconate lactonizing enzyme C-terminal domain-containing protein n=1 Tax=Handelsmanbacteria sp. (strain RIFCSPLOWO2_12_FULL_64_10) TaxID=1817868 RepID=A0A1F6CWE8_HANXR|nr:MAG: hypothetical protein A3F84_13615 [Candidatus Handelsmanbacteria bacterium RIFCSPLOWO2_12_FULL_64_10]